MENRTATEVAAEISAMEREFGTPPQGLDREGFCRWMVNNIMGKARQKAKQEAAPYLAELVSIESMKAPSLILYQAEFQRLGGMFGKSDAPQIQGMQPDDFETPS